MPYSGAPPENKVWPACIDFNVPGLTEYCNTLPSIFQCIPGLPDTYSCVWLELWKESEHSHLRRFWSGVVQSRQALHLFVPYVYNISQFVFLMFCLSQIVVAKRICPSLRPMKANSGFVSGPVDSYLWLLLIFITTVCTDNALHQRHQTGGQCLPFSYWKNAQLGGDTGFVCWWPWQVKAWSHQHLKMLNFADKINLLVDLPAGGGEDICGSRSSVAEWRPAGLVN